MSAHRCPSRQALPRLSLGAWLGGPHCGCCGRSGVSPRPPLRGAKPVVVGPGSAGSGGRLRNAGNPREFGQFNHPRRTNTTYRLRSTRQAACLPSGVVNAVFLELIKLTCASIAGTIRAQRPGGNVTGSRLEGNREGLARSQAIREERKASPACGRPSRLSLLEVGGDALAVSNGGLHSATGS